MQAVAKYPVGAAQQIQVSARRADDPAITAGTGTASIGADPKSELRTQDLRLSDPASLRVFQDLTPGTVLGEEAACSCSSAGSKSRTKRSATGSSASRRSSHKRLRARRRGCAGVSWYLDETYMKVAGRWCYLYRAIDRDGALIDSMLSEHRDKRAARRFLRRLVEMAGHKPLRVTTDAHPPYRRAIRWILGRKVWHQCSQYLNNLTEQSHRAIKQRYYPMPGFGSFASAARFFPAFDELGQSWGCKYTSVLTSASIQATPASISERMCYWCPAIIGAVHLRCGIVRLGEDDQDRARGGERRAHMMSIERSSSARHRQGARVTRAACSILPATATLSPNKDRSGPVVAKYIIRFQANPEAWPADSAEVLALWEQVLGCGSALLEGSTPAEISWTSGLAGCAIMEPRRRLRSSESRRPSFRCSTRSSTKWCPGRRPHQTSWAAQRRPRGIKGGAGSVGSI